jgi:serine/threonine protein kinase
MTGNIGTLLYTSPEVFQNKTYNEKCDVYSFAMVMYEMFFERTPFSDEYIELEHFITVFHHAQEIISGRRPIIPEDYIYNEPELEFISLMKVCWNQEPSIRPTFAEIFININDILTML